jgi:hypothetical protein
MQCGMMDLVSSEAEIVVRRCRERLLDGFMGQRLSFVVCAPQHRARDRAGNTHRHPPNPTTLQVR